MFVFAQLSTSVSDDQIRLIIMALLVVAVLLAALTTWYFVKTSPSRRVRTAQARRQPTGASRAGVTGAGTAASAANPAQPRPTASASPSHGGVATNEADDDEWDRLTAPEPRRPANS